MTDVRCQNGHHLPPWECRLPCYGQQMTPEIQAAAIGVASAIAVALATSWATSRSVGERLRAELRTQFMAEEAIHGLLQHSDWKKRSFDRIRMRIRSFEDDELRQLLVRAGTVAFEARDSKEIWGLRSVNKDDLG